MCSTVPSLRKNMFALKQNLPSVSGLFVCFSDTVPLLIKEGARTVPVVHPGILPFSCRRWGAADA